MRNKNKYNGISQNRHSTSISIWLIALIVAVWIFSGVIGHEPWKPDEAYTFGLVYHIVRGGDWAVPMLAGEPFVEKPPLYFLVASGFAKAFSPWFSLHDAARLSTAFFITISCLFTGLTAKRLHGKGHGIVAVLILLGSVGLLVRGHQLITDVALLSGFTISYYAFAISNKNPWFPGLLLGTGVGIGFLSKGLIAPGVLGAIAIVLPLGSKHWRNRNYAAMLGIALIVVLPWILIWPLFLYLQSPELFYQWLFVQNWGRFIGTANLGYQNEAFFYFRILPWYAWPAWPIALWVLWRERGPNLLRPAILLPLVCFSVLILILGVAGEARELYALPLLPALAILASARLDFLSGQSRKILNLALMTLFGLCALGLWLAYVVTTTNITTWVKQWISKTMLVEYTQPFSTRFCVSAALATGIYLLVLIRTKSDTDHFIIRWTAGVTIIWALVMTLWLPLIDETKAYRSLVQNLLQQLPRNGECVASQGLGEPQRALFEYYAGLITQRWEIGRGQNCPYLLQQEFMKNIAEPDSKWSKVWQGSRPGDPNEHFRLYRLQNK